MTVRVWGDDGPDVDVDDGQLEPIEVSDDRASLRRALIEAGRRVSSKQLSAAAGAACARLWLGAAQLGEDEHWQQIHDKLDAKLALLDAAQDALNKSGPRAVRPPRGPTHTRDPETGKWIMTDPGDPGDDLREPH